MIISSRKFIALASAFFFLSVVLVGAQDSANTELLERLIEKRKHPIDPSKPGGPKARIGHAIVSLEFPDLTIRYTDPGEDGFVDGAIGDFAISSDAPEIRLKAGLYSFGLVEGSKKPLLRFISLDDAAAASRDVELTMSSGSLSANLQAPNLRVTRGSSSYFIFIKYHHLILRGEIH